MPTTSTSKSYLLVTAPSAKIKWTVVWVAATAATVTAAAVTVQTKAATTTTATIPEMPYKINGAARGPETTPVRGQRFRALLPR